MRIELLEQRTKRLRSLLVNMSNDNEALVARDFWVIVKSGTFQATEICMKRIGTKIMVSTHVFSRPNRLHVVRRFKIIRVKDHLT